MFSLHTIVVFCFFFLFFFFNDTATTEIYTLSLHDALPISLEKESMVDAHRTWVFGYSLGGTIGIYAAALDARSEEHTSELQSRENLVCRLLLEKKKNKKQGYFVHNPSTTSVNHLHPINVAP